MDLYKINNNVVRDEEEDLRSRNSADEWIFGLLLIVIGLIPLIVGGYVGNVVSPKITGISELSSGEKGDIFTRYKMIILLVITIIATGILFAKVLFMNGELRKTSLNIFIAIFIIAILLSTILSPSISIAFYGQYNRSDGMISYICYIVLFFIAININYPKKAINYVMYSLYPFILINLLLITMNFVGHDAMTFSVVQNFVTMFLPEGATLGRNPVMLGTLNQWNFMSGMFAIMTVMYLSWAIVDSNRIRSFVNTFIAIAAFSIMLMSISTSGFVTVVALLPLLIVLVMKSNTTKKAIVVMLVFFIVSVPIFHILADKNPKVWTESIGFFIKKNPYVIEQPTATKVTNSQFSFENRAFAAENQFELPELPERSISAGTGRFYIWQKTFDLTMKRPLFGYGLDTLMYHFPHYNIDARAGIRDEKTIVDKPHSMYVGVLYGTGIVGFISFAGIAILTVIAVLKVVFTRKQAMINVFALGWLAFLTQALFNDSLPGTAGPMWVIAGIMMGMILIKNEVEGKIDGRND